MNRRHFMKISSAAAGLALIPVCNLSEAVDAPIMLSPEDPQAKALGYIEVSVTAGSNCSGCVQSKGDAGAKLLSCNIFAGKQVKATGWCKVWAKRP